MHRNEDKTAKATPPASGITNPSNPLNADGIIQSLKDAYKSNDDKQIESTKKDLTKYLNKVFEQVVKRSDVRHAAANELGKILIYLYGNNLKKLSDDIIKEKDFPLVLSSQGTFTYREVNSKTNTILVRDFINKKVEQHFNPLKRTSEILNEVIIEPVKNWVADYEANPQYTRGKHNAPQDTIENVTKLNNKALAFTAFQTKFNFEYILDFEPPKLAANSIARNAGLREKIPATQEAITKIGKHIISINEIISKIDDAIIGKEGKIGELDQIMEIKDMEIKKSELKEVELIEIRKMEEIEEAKPKVEELTEIEIQEPGEENSQQARKNRKFTYPNEKYSQYKDRTQKDLEILDQLQKRNVYKTLENAKKLLAKKREVLAEAVTGLEQKQTKLTTEKTKLEEEKKTFEKNQELKKDDGFYNLQSKLQSTNFKWVEPYLTEKRNIESEAQEYREEDTPDPNKKLGNDNLGLRLKVILYDLYQEKINNKTFDKTNDAGLINILEAENILKLQENGKYIPDYGLKSLEVSDPTNFQYQKFRNLVSKSTEDFNFDFIKNTILDIDRTMSDVNKKRLLEEIKDRDALRIFEQAIIDAYYKIRAQENYTRISQNRDAYRKFGNIIENFIKAKSGLDLIEKYSIDIPHKLNESDAPKLTATLQKKNPKKIAFVHSSCLHDSKNQNRFNKEFFNKLKFEYDEVIFWGTEPDPKIKEELYKHLNVQFKSTEKFGIDDFDKLQNDEDVKNLFKEATYRYLQRDVFERKEVMNLQRHIYERKGVIECTNYSSPASAGIPLEKKIENEGLFHFKNALQKYINLRRLEKNKSGSSFFNFSIYGRWKGFSAEVKIEAAEKLIKFINGKIKEKEEKITDDPKRIANEKINWEEITDDPIHIAALQDGMLGSIVSRYTEAYPEFKLMLPKELEKPFLPSVSELILSK